MATQLCSLATAFIITHADYHSVGCHFISLIIMCPSPRTHVIPLTQSWLPMLRMRTTRSTLVPRPAAKDAPAAVRVYVFALAHTRTHGVVEGGGKRSCQVCTLLQHPPH